MEAGDLLGLQIPSNEAHVWARAATLGPLAAASQKWGDPGAPAPGRKVTPESGPGTTRSAGLRGRLGPPNSSPVQAARTL